MREKQIKTDEDFEGFCKVAAGFKRQGWRVLELYKYPKGTETKYCMREVRLFVGEVIRVRYLSDEVSRELRKKHASSAAFLGKLWEKGEVKGE